TLEQGGGAELGATVGPGIPSYILLALSYQGHTLTQKYLQDALAHEFFHVLQTSVAKQAGGWWRDATATWAIEKVFHGDNLEQTPDFGLQFPQRFFDLFATASPSIDTATGLDAYGTYVFPWYLAKTLGPGVVGRIWQDIGNGTGTLQAISDELGGAGLRALWPKFMSQNWGRSPFDKYASWDGPFGDPAASKVWGVANAVAPFPMAIDSVEGIQALDLHHLSGRYYDWTFPGTARTLTFVDQPPYGEEDGDPRPLDPDAAVTALITRGGQAKSETLTGKPGFAECSTLTGSPIQELMLLFTNSKIDGSLTKPDPDPQLIVSDDGCAEWSGTIDAKSVDQLPSGKETEASHTSVTFTYQAPTSLQPFGYYKATGHVDWTLSGCYSGSDSFDLGPKTTADLELGWNGALLAPNGYTGGISGSQDNLGRRHYVAQCSGGHKILWYEVLPWSSSPDGKPKYLTGGGLVMTGKSTFKGSGRTDTWSWNLNSGG